MGLAAKVLFVSHASRLSDADLVLLDVAKGFRGGSAFLFEDGPLRSALAAVGITPIVPARGTGFASTKRDRSLLRAPSHLGGLIGTVARLARIARRFDVIYANSHKAFALAALACTIARRPLVWHLHDILTTERFGAGRIKLMVQLANRFATRVIVPSRVCADAFAAAGGRAVSRIVPDGVDSLDGDVRPMSAADLGLPFDTKVIFGVFSRLAPCQGQAVALRALQAVPEAGCIIAGGALFGGDDYARSLVALAAELGVTDRVRFLGHREDVPVLMRSVDAVVHPSVAPEPFGRTLVEAMLARRPVIASNTGAVPEILDGGRVGLMFPPGDDVALAACLRQVRSGATDALLDPAEARALAFHSASGMRAGIKAVVAEVLENDW